MGERFTILFVCTGNICRSPMAEAIARQRLDAVLGDEAVNVAVASVGTQALVGEPPVARALDVLTERGLEGGAHAARQLTAEFVDAADLVLTAGRAQRAAVVTLVPSAVGKTFTLREFARLADAVDPEALPHNGPAARAYAVVSASVEHRARVPPVDAYADDVSDPYSRDIEEFRKCARTIDEALEALSLLGR